MRGLCGAESGVHGAGKCPRLRDHDGPHYWWIPWLDGRQEWRVTVYAGDLTSGEERHRVTRGVFVEKPSIGDVARLVQTIAPMRKRELARRTPASEPEDPPPRAVRVRTRRARVERVPGGMVVVRA